MYAEGGLFRISVPSNWRELPDNNAVIFAPDGAYGTGNGQRVFTHGMEIGIARNETHDVRTATDEFVASLASANPNLGQPSRYSRAKIGGQQGLRTTLSNRSATTSQEERVAVFTMLLDDGSLFYALGVAPRDRFSDYEGTFRKVVGSIAFVR